jgi:hypothetical protein
VSGVCRLPEVKIFVRKPEGKFPPRIQKNKGEDNVKVDLKEIDFEDVCMCWSYLLSKAYPHSFCGLHIQFHICSSDGLLVIALKLGVKENYCMVTVL